MARELKVRRLVITKLDNGSNHAHFEYSVKDGDLSKNGMQDEADLDLSKSVDTLLADFGSTKGDEENIPKK
jgi:hypothetical protein